ncbi:MAG: helix-turn-helix domain-containing protein [Acetobacteraceae bacterium]|nr:helix-turn-helix domain-containing protein [Acetobacteraceae bacterium]
MHAVTVANITDVEVFRAAIRPAGSDFLVTGRGPFLASVTKVDLPRLWMQAFQETLPRTWRVETQRVAIAFSAMGEPPSMCRGVEVGANQIGFVHPRQTVWHSLSGPTKMAAMSLPEHEFGEIGAAITGCNFELPRNALAAAVAPERLTRLRRLHAAATNVAETAPEIIAHPEAARGLEASLTEAMFGCLADGTMRTDNASSRQHRKIMRRFHALVEDSCEQALYLSEVCATIGVAQRTLYNVCLEQLGMSPKRFLLLRRLHLAHQALRLATQNETVTDIATRYGFWELGRFAGYYRAVFGQSPSKALGSAYR